MDRDNPYAPPPAKLSAVLPRNTRRRGLWDGNWISFMLLMPFVLLCVASVPLGISDAFLMGDRWDATYNLCTALALVLGSVTFVIHALALPSIKGYGWGWVAPKFIFLAACWGLFVAVSAFKTTFLT